MGESVLHLSEKHTVFQAQYSSAVMNVLMRYINRDVFYVLWVIQLLYLSDACRQQMEPLTFKPSHHNHHML